MRPGAMPVIELQSVQMPTKFGKKPRPFFKIVGLAQPRTSVAVMKRRRARGAGVR